MRKSPTSKDYISNDKLENFSIEAIKSLNESIKQDELKEAQQNGFETYDEYMLSYYEEKVKNKKVVDFKDICSLLYYKNKVSNNSSTKKR